MPEQSAEIKTSNLISTLDVKYFTEGRFQVGHKWNYFSSVHRKTQLLAFCKDAPGVSGGLLDDSMSLLKLFL